MLSTAPSSSVFVRCDISKAVRSSDLTYVGTVSVLLSHLSTGLHPLLFFSVFPLPSFPFFPSLFLSLFHSLSLSPSGLAYCRHLSTVRTHLSALVNHNMVTPDKPCEASGGLSKDVWSKYQKDCKVREPGTEAGSPGIRPVYMKTATLLLNSFFPLVTRDVHRNFEGQLLCPGKKGHHVNICHRRHAPVPWTLIPQLFYLGLH